MGGATVSNLFIGLGFSFPPLTFHRRSPHEETTQNVLTLLLTHLCGSLRTQYRSTNHLSMQSNTKGVAK